jgi:hypothetical protein
VPNKGQKVHRWSVEMVEMRAWYHGYRSREKWTCERCGQVKWKKGQRVPPCRGKPT